MLLEKACVSIVGASGAVGREALSILCEQGHPPEQIHLFGSKRSAGHVITESGHEFQIHEYSYEAASTCDSAILCTSAGISRTVGPKLAESGLIVVDNSSAFRMNDTIPLVVPEINGHLLHDGSHSGIIASPNCSTIMMLLAVKPVADLAGLASVTVATYQAVSGAGLPAMAELEHETQRYLEGAPSAPKIFPISCAFNVFPHESAGDKATGFCGEEHKIIAESRKILDLPDLDVLPTCVRVPVHRCHSQAIVVETETPMSVQTIEDAFRNAPSIDFIGTRCVTPLNSQGTNTVRIGPIRASTAKPATRFSIWACCDQLRKGAALNALQILELTGRD